MRPTNESRKLVTPSQQRKLREQIRAATAEVWTLQFAETPSEYAQLKQLRLGSRAHNEGTRSIDHTTRCEGRFMTFEQAKTVARVEKTAANVRLHRLARSMAAGQQRVSDQSCYRSSCVHQRRLDPDHIRTNETVYVFKPAAAGSIARTTAPVHQAVQTDVSSAYIVSVASVASLEPRELPAVPHKACCVTPQNGLEDSTRRLYRISNRLAGQVASVRMPLQCVCQATATSFFTHCVDRPHRPQTPPVPASTVRLLPRQVVSV